MNPDGTDTNSTAELSAFINGLRSRVKADAPRTVLPDFDNTVRQVGDADNLVDVFTSAASAAGTQVHATNASDLNRCLCDLLREHGAKRVFIAVQDDSAMPKRRAGELVAEMKACGVEATFETDDETLFTVDAAITGVAAGVAETGTIVCTSGAGQARGGSLIPPVHIAVMTRAQILPDLCDYFDCRREEVGFAGSTHPTDRCESDRLPANVNLISGPSKTADIEGILIKGVHGPGVVHVVLLDD